MRTNPNMASVSRMRAPDGRDTGGRPMPGAIAEARCVRVPGWSGGDPCPPHPGARVHCCRCSLPGLTGFTIYRRGGTDEGRHRPLLQGCARETGIAEAARTGAVTSSTPNRGRHCPRFSNIFHPMFPGRLIDFLASTLFFYQSHWVRFQNNRTAH